MSTARRLAAIPLVLALAACGGGGTGATPTDSGSAPPAASHGGHASPSSGESAPASDAPSGEPSAEPTGDAVAEPFTCDLPIVDAGTVPIANIVDVRVGTHSDHDRVVFEFEQGTPEFTLGRAEPPFTQDGSGMPMEVEGESFLGLTMRGGTKQTDAGDSSYDGSTEFEPGFDTLIHAVEAGDFERQSTWYLGLAEEECVRVLLLDDPPRLVIDVEH